MREARLSLSKPWLVGAFVVAALLHIGIAILIFWVPTPTEAQGQAVAAGTGGIEISLGPAGRSEGGPKTQEGEEKPALKEEPEPPQELSEPEPQPKPPQSQPPKPEPEQKPQPEAATPPAKPQPVAEPTAPKPQAMVAGDAGKSGTTEHNNTGTGDNTSGGGIPGDTKDYAATLLAWLERHKEYPRSARLRRQQGTVLLYFVMNREGKVLNQRIQQSSGYPNLDEAALAMLERAQPLPVMPDSINKETLELVVPVEFFLR